MKELLPIEGQNVPLSNEDQWLYFGDYYDPLLDYVEQIANEYSPNGYPAEEFSPGYGYTGSRATGLFAVAYINGKINKSFEDKFARNKEIQDTIHNIGLNEDKFWYLLLFINDYSSKACNNGYKVAKSAKKQIEDMVTGIYNNMKSLDQKSGEVTFDKPISIELKIKSKHTIKIEDPKAIQYIATSMTEKLKQVQGGSMMTDERILFSANGELGCEAESNSVLIYYFAKMFLDFFKLNPQFSKRRGKDDNISYNKKLLISRLIYLVGITENDKFNDSDETLNGYLRQYKDYKIASINLSYM